MKSQLYTRVINLMLVSSIYFTATAQTPVPDWQKRYGGIYTDGFNAVAQTHDGGYVTTGIYNVGNYNCWIQKMDTSGNVEWSKNYGGTNQEAGHSVFQANDGNYIVGGTTGSANGDVTGYHGGDDAWILKLNNEGNIIWRRCYGGSSHDGVSKLLPTADGNFLALGLTSSDDGDLAGINTVGFWGESNIWLMKLDTAGNILWQKTYGGLSYDAGYDIVSMPEGGYVIAGTEATATGMYDVFVSRIDTLGNEVWKKVFGYSDYDYAYSMIATNTNDIIIGGITLSPDFPGFKGGGTDAIMAKLDGASGDVIWHKAIGGSMAEWFTGITKYHDSYILAGTSSSDDKDISHPLGNWDIWLVAIDENGNIQWDKNLGGSGEDAGSAYDVSIIPTAGDGLLIAGMTGSDEISGGGGSWDGCIFKLKQNQITIVDNQSPDISIYPNPSTDYLHIHTSNTENYFYRLIDVNGKILQSGKIETNETIVDLRSLSPAVYFLQLQNNNTQLTRKIIKE